MFNEDDNLFGGSPEKKYFDIIFNASKGLVENQLRGNIERIVIMEKMLEELLEDENIERRVKSYIIENPDEVENMVVNRYIVDVGDILTQNE